MTSLDQISPVTLNVLERIADGLKPSDRIPEGFFHLGFLERCGCDNPHCEGVFISEELYRLDQKLGPVLCMQFHALTRAWLLLALALVRQERETAKAETTP
jgi:hypothetical protein